MEKQRGTKSQRHMWRHRARSNAAKKRTRLKAPASVSSTLKKMEPRIRPNTTLASTVTTKVTGCATMSRTDRENRIPNCRKGLCSAVRWTLRSRSGVSSWLRSPLTPSSSESWTSLLCEDREKASTKSPTVRGAVDSQPGVMRPSWKLGSLTVVINSGMERVDGRVKPSDLK